ncbi:NAD(P)H-dependent oxidoreductase [Pseudomonas sp. NFR16]|uniref:NAD(P)H-dependent oxidoreductase n=1 Tax=Pseudomonas sp. NFR16 TaxID=1566248 RepID=UPI0008B0967C|nr:NAD(P)H-dependent oxidoreductase [Pseudomonas sp. NFR16]SEI45231.1 Nitroreductase [Pseudomonas sp. NFR16]
MLSSHMQWRYATKKFDPSAKVSEAELQELLLNVQLAPTSYGLQPFKVIDVRTPELRAQIREAAIGQPQITEGSHLLVFAVCTDLDSAAVAQYIDLAAITRGLSRETLAPRETHIQGAVNKLLPSERILWSQKQAYLAMGVLVSAAAQMQIDICPMEGFDRTQVDRILGLTEQGLASTVFAVIGHRAADDPAAGLAKVRKSADQLFLTL